MIVTIKKLNRFVNWGASDRSGKLLVKYDGCFDKIVPAIDITTGLLRTGLSKTEQTKLEEDLQMPEGYLKPSSEFWDTFSIQIPAEGLKLNTDNPMDNLMYKVLAADKEVLTDVTKLDITAGAGYLMTSESEVAKTQNTKRHFIVQAYAKFATMTPNEVIDVLYMYGKDADFNDSEICKNVVGDLIDKDPKMFLEIYGDEQFKEKTWLAKLIRAGIVKKGAIARGFDVPLYFGDICLGTGLDEAVTFLLDKENNTIYVGMQKAYQAYKKI